MRIALIAGYSSKEIRKHLELKNDSKLYHGLIRLLRLPARVGIFSDTVPWVIPIIDDLKKRPDVELHVVAPHIRLKKNYQRFEMGEVTYHYFPAELTSILRLLRNYKLWKILQQSKRHARRILKEIKPDIVLLSGAENPVTSGAIFGAAEYPCVCLCQTIYNDPKMFKYTKPDRLRQQLELDIFREIKYFGVYCKKHYDLLRANSIDRFIFRFNYPTSTNFPIPLDIPKEYDFVNFAQLHSAAKGTPDSIKALAIVKRQFPNVTLNIVGGCDSVMRSELENIITENNLEDNVVFTPFIEQKEDLLKHIQKSRFGVLPCKLDNTSGTMSQCMIRRIPIVVYKTTGTPAFNKVRQCALIAEMDDIEGLANHMITLMSNLELAEELKENGRWYKENQAEIHIKNWQKFVEIMPYIIEHFSKGTPIPQKYIYIPNTED